MEKIETQLKELIKQRYESPRQFAIQIGMPYTTLDSILKRGILKSNVLNVITICEALNISADSLAKGRIEEIKKPATISDDGRIRKIAKGFSRLTPENQEIALAMIQAMQSDK